MDSPARDRIAAVAILARNNGYEDVCKWIMAREKRERTSSGKVRRRKQVLYTPRGEKVELYQETVKRLKEGAEA